MGGFAGMADQDAFCMTCFKVTDAASITYDPILMRIRIDVKCHGQSYVRIVPKEICLRDPKKAFTFFPVKG
jgi:hypothetical protein